MPKKMPYDYPVLDDKPIDQWRVTELREELRRRKLATKGLKEELVRRLDEAMRNEMEAQNNGELGDEIEGNSDVQNNTEENEADPVEEDNADVLIDHNKNDDADAGMIDINLGIPDINQGNEDQNGEAAEVAGLARLVGKEGTTDTLEDNASCNQNAISQSGAQVETVPIQKHDNSKPPIEESVVILSESNNQVSEVNQGLEFQVNYVSNIDSVSLNDKNNIKDNLTADNMPLELEVVKQEVVPQSSNNYPPADDVCIVRDDQVAVLKHLSNEQGACENHVLDEQYMDKNLMSDEKEGSKKFASDEQDDGQNHVFVGQEASKVHAPMEDAGVETDSNGDLSKKEDSADGGGSSEKLNLDRSSGDESVDEDMSEHKLIETEIKSVEPVDKFEVKHEVDDGASDVALSKTSLSKIDIALENAKSVFTIEKRKIEESEVVTENDTPKRQRRWNPDTIKVPEQQTSHVSISGTQKNNEQPSLRNTFNRSNSMLIGDSPKERSVPPPKKLATSSLRIDNFLRPFTLKAVQDLLAKTGKVCDFWMDHIKTHCYVTFSSVEEATDTRNAVYNLQWPPNGGRLLAAEFVDPQEVKMRLEAPPQSPAPVSPNPATLTVAPPRTQSPQLIRQQTLIKQQTQLPLPPQLAQPPPPHLNPPIAVDRAQRQPANPPKKLEPPAVTLDDLFKKTRSSPRIYYLPLSEEQVAAKLAAQGKSSTQV